MTKRPYCLAPFVHMYIHSMEDSRLCCVSNEVTRASSNTDFNLETRWNSEYYQKYRTLFLSDNISPPTECSACTVNEQRGVMSDRQMFNDMYSHIDFDFDVTHGTQFKSPIDIDLRPSNLCNLKCRMCNPGSSSQIDKELRSYSNVLNFLDPIDDTDDILSLDNLNFILSNIQHGKRLKFLGGEPTIMPEVERILDYLIRHELYEVPLKFTINVTNDNKRFLSKLQNFKNIEFTFSIDGTGKTVEYIRNPIKWKSIANNIKSYMDIPVRNFNTAFTIQYTLQAYNVFNTYEFLNWCNEFNSNRDKKIYPRINVLHAPMWFRHSVIPKELRDKEYTKILESELINTDIMKRYSISTAIKMCKDDLQLHDQSDAYQKFIDRTKRYDIVRKQHIKDYIPEIWEIIKEEYDAIQI